MLQMTFVYIFERYLYILLYYIYLTALVTSYFWVKIIFLLSFISNHLKIKPSLSCELEGPKRSGTTGLKYVTVYIL